MPFSRMKFCKGCGNALWGDDCPKEFHSWMETKYGDFHVKCFIKHPSITQKNTMKELLIYADAE